MQILSNVQNVQNRWYQVTRSSAVAERPRIASCHCIFC